MPSLALLVAGPVAQRTGGSLYNRRMAEELAGLGWQVELRELHGDFPDPERDDLARAARLMAALPDRTTVVVDGMALSAMPDIVEREAARLLVVALVHLPIAAAIGLTAETRARFEAWERRALAAASRVIVTGPGALPLLAPYELPAERVVTIEPGTDPRPLATGTGSPVQLLAVGTVNRGKGYDVLLEALAAAPPDWRLACAGSLTREPDTSARVEALARRLGLDQQVVFVGDLEAGALERWYDAADVFVLATQQETYGMAVAEALAYGLPVVSTTTGAIPTLVGEDAGLLSPPGDTARFASAIARVIGDADLRRRLADGARRARTRLGGWEQAASRLAAALEGTRHG